MLGATWAIATRPSADIRDICPHMVLLTERASSSSGSRPLNVAQTGGKMSLGRMFAGSRLSTRNESWRVDSVDRVASVAS